ncbi:C6 zinc finger domain-containing protein [Penicillium hispanicum]|uniref:C6 zinc finger domain-containing protein n=1 Tax=Penicillium hispanicum TaxID=1080232 RepID=UPI0025400E61|nr:C6 zinc finger domain-containing protein [Penicillium hispanicum]KAJ5577951.1 C6 zinc finger domain-containing protein [Penicillium hispanicum]
METRRRHCWECSRRRLVCDSTRPECTRCAENGVQCPGYGDAQPFQLRWLAPGKINSRNRRRGAKHEGLPTPPPRECPGTSSPDEAKEAPPENMLSPHVMKTDADALWQAIEYFNTRMYPDMSIVNELGPNYPVHSLSREIIQAGVARPDYLRLNLICVTLNHRLNRAKDNTQAKFLSRIFYNYRGRILRSLNGDLDIEQKRNSDHMIAGILAFALADAHQGESPLWRAHLQGVQRLISLRGGVRALASSDTSLPMVLCYVYITVIGDTTSPACNLTMASPLLEELDPILQRFDNSNYGFNYIPWPVFVGIFKINQLRAQAFTTLFTPRDDGGPTEAEWDTLIESAHETLSRIRSFDPHQWSQSKPSAKHDWEVLARVYQAAAVLYCISSLQSVSVLPDDESIHMIRTTNRHLLQVFLQQAMLSRRIRGFLLWSTVVLGMEAVHGDSMMRDWVKEQLKVLQYAVASYVPIMAKGLLERFWASGSSSWDACFDKPYALATQPTVSRAQLK